jgi:polyhydroxybutyrate depolymerase
VPETTATNPPTTSPDAAPVADQLVPAVTATGAATHGTLTFAGVQRTYRLYIPRNLPAGAVPLFIGLHGGGGWGDQFAQTDHIEGLAESNGFIVVHPDGTKIASGQGGVWNGGICCGVASRTNVDDVGFINALIAQLVTDHSIDSHRIFAYGHSNGAIMSYRLACDLSNRIVGIGLYAGTLGIPTCSPAQAVSVIHIHGTADENIPINGGPGSESKTAVDFPAPHAGFDTLAKLDECNPPAATVAGDISAALSSQCKAGTAAEFVTIMGANHSWPDGTPIVPPANGPGYSGYDATAQIVAFLLAHPRP